MTEKAVRILMTGANGFVGPHLVVTLREMFGRHLELCLTSRLKSAPPITTDVEKLDVTDAQAVERVIARFMPTHLIHLAGLAAIRAAVADTPAAWQVHLVGTLNIANAILSRAPNCSLISAGSGQIYGSSARSGQHLDEATLLAPTNGYEVTKAAADLALGSLACQGLRCVRMRPFNHAGTGQSEEFVVPSFAMQIARIEAGLQPPVIRVGNLDAERDFLDVRDVTSAYALAVVKSAELAPGTILNIASGVPLKIRAVLDRLLALSSRSISVEFDPARARASDTPRFVGDARLAQRLLGWLPKHSFDGTLLDVLTHSRRLVSAKL